MRTRESDDGEGVAIEDIVKKSNPQILYELDKRKNMAKKDAGEEANEIIRAMDLSGIMKQLQPKNNNGSNGINGSNTNRETDTDTENTRSSFRPHISTAAISDTLSERSSGDVQSPSMKKVLDSIKEEEEEETGEVHKSIDELNINDGETHEEAMSKLRKRLPGGQSALSIEEEFLNTLEDCGVARAKKYIITQFFRNPDDPQWLWDTMTEAVIPEKVKRMVCTSWYNKAFDDLGIDTGLPGSKSRGSKSTSRKKSSADDALDELDELDNREVERLANEAKKKQLQERISGKTSNADSDELVEVPIIDKNTGQPMTDAKGNIILVKITPKQLFLQTQYGGGGGNGGDKALLLELMKLSRQSDDRMLAMQQQNQQTIMNMMSGFVNAKSESDKQLYSIDRQYRERDLERYRQQLQQSTPEATLSLIRTYTKMAEDNGLIRVDRDDPLKKQIMVIDGVKGLGKELIGELKPTLTEAIQMAREDYRESKGLPSKVKMSKDERQAAMAELSLQLDNPDVQRYLKQRENNDSKQNDELKENGEKQ